jgi:hypothetical protein
MTYLLRFIQSYKPAHRKEFLALESQFQSLERQSKTLPKGLRSQPLAGGEPNHSLIWECEFASLAEVQKALQSFEDDPEHTRLFELQAPYIVEIRTEILERLSFPE